MPVSTLKSVVLPAPLGPIMVKICPGLTSKLTSSTARSPPKVLLTLSTRSMGGPVRLGSGAAGAVSGGADAALITRNPSFGPWRGAQPAVGDALFQLGLPDPARQESLGAQQ